MKTKPNYWYKQSAIIPYRIIDENIEVLLITSRKKKRWIVPKGIVEETLSSFCSAKKEALEEAGVEGEGSGKIIGKYKYKKWGGKCKVKVYTMEVKTIHQKWDEEFRERKWVKVNDIKYYLHNKKLLRIIENEFKKVKP